MEVLIDRTGPATGLGQVSIARYSFGYYPSKIISTLNVVCQLGWSAIACITGGLALTAVSDGRVSLQNGVAFIAVIGFCLSFLGLRAVLRYEQFAWLTFLVIFSAMYGEVAKNADSTTKTLLKGQNLSGAVLSLLSVVYGVSASWASIVADYYVQYPKSTSKVKVFAVTSLSITIPTSFAMILGCLVGSMLVNDDISFDAYKRVGVGHLIQTMIHPRGFAKFILALMVLSGSKYHYLSP